MAELRKKISVAQHIVKKVFQTKWVVYAKRPFASPKTVVEYLGRYTHKIAISNHRLKKVDQENVIFTYKDYRQEGKNKQIKLGGSEFLRRFSSHILPSGFVRIRHYGFLASRNKNKELNLAKKDLNQPKWQKVKYSWVQIAKEKLNYNPERCHCCGYETLITTKLIAPERGPPLRQLLKMHNLANNHTLSKRLHWTPWNIYVLGFLRPQKSMKRGLKNATRQSIRPLFNNFNTT
ncbi:transposase [Cyclobacterium amurskyense]|uniref:Transposase n=1 Tax=Cyclobacterium amurskyense TaxID=320787 RepID=A0A0H4PF22_9BACT|nr:transposase [Cyclobacterium amurskyense]